MPVRSGRLCYVGNAWLTHVLTSAGRVAERGAQPNVPAWRLKALRGLRAMFTPLMPDDYLELINPLWSTQELRGRIETIDRETADAATIVIKPGWEWPGHEPGQYLRIGMAVDGIHHWRAYSLTSDPGRADGCISITPKLVEAGKVSPFLVREARPGAIVRLGGVEGTFVLPDPLPRRMLFVSAGSGITPIMSMLHALDRLAALGDVPVLRGNADRLALEGAGKHYQWVRDRLGEDRLAAIATWPLTFAIEVETLGAVRCCHALPGDDERGLTRITPEGDFAAELDGIVEPTVIGGHTHVQFDRAVGRWRYVNVGSVGRPYEGRPGAYWALLGPDEIGRAHV